jgi:hypothetical protein
MSPTGGACLVVRERKRRRGGMGWAAGSGKEGAKWQAGPSGREGKVGKREGGEGGGPGQTEKEREREKKVNANAFEFKSGI